MSITVPSRLSGGRALRNSSSQALYPLFLPGGEAVFYHLHGDVVRHHILYAAGLFLGMGCHLGTLFQLEWGSICFRFVEQQVHLSVQMLLGLLAGYIYWNKRKYGNE